MSKSATAVLGAPVGDNPLKILVRFARLQPVGAFCAVLLMLITLSAIFASVISPFDPTFQNRNGALAAPSPQNWFGTDNLGRDVLSRVIFGAQTSLKIGILAVLMGTVLGSIIGLVSGYFGGNVDLLVQRVMDSVLAFPTLVLAMVVIAVLGPGLDKVILAVAIVQLPRVARIVRGSVLSIKNEVYVEAARTVGAGSVRIMAQHILPNVIAPIIVMATITLGQAILVEASLSFLGLGPPPPTPSWGGMLSEAGRNFLLRAPWIAFFPGIAITLTVLSVNLLGDTLRDHLDPRLRSSQ